MLSNWNKTPIYQDRFDRLDTLLTQKKYKEADVLLGEICLDKTIALTQQCNKKIKTIYDKHIIILRTEHNVRLMELY